MRWLFIVAIAAALVASACSSSGTDSSGPAETTSPPATVTTTAVPTTTTTTSAAVEPAAVPALNEIQVVGSHNSYKLHPSEAVADGLSLFAPELGQAIDYSHLPLAEQLEEYGIRQIEIDVYADPEGGLYADRNLMSIIGEPVESGIAELDQPGFKVMHIQDVDFETTCLTLIACLVEVETWSSANPDHAPVLIMLETKTAGVAENAEVLGFDLSSLGVVTPEPPKMTETLFTDLEAEVLSVFPRDRIITPDEVRGEHTSLHDAVGQSGWPDLDSARGRVLFALVETGADSAVYKEGAPALEGRLFFTSATVGDPDGAFVRIDDPIGEADAIAEALAAGYLVRTRADADTLEARAGDGTRRDAAFASGAQFVSTDYYLEDPSLSSYVVALPGGAALRCNPVTADAGCSALTG